MLFVPRKRRIEARKKIIQAGLDYQEKQYAKIREEMKQNRE